LAVGSTIKRARYREHERDDPRRIDTRRDQISDALRDEFGLSRPRRGDDLPMGTAVLNGRKGLARQPRRSGGRHIRT